MIAYQKGRSRRAPASQHVAYTALSLSLSLVSYAASCSQGATIYLFACTTETLPFSSALTLVCSPSVYDGKETHERNISCVGLNIYQTRDFS